MNILIFFISIYSLTAINNMYAGNDEELFLRANKWYQEEKCASALELYSAIKNKGPAVWYNMGNCYYHTDNHLEALACWYRAKKGATRALYNQIDTNSALIIPDLEKSKENGIGFFYKKIEMFVVSISLLFLQIFLLLVVYVSWIWYRWCALQKNVWVPMLIVGVLVMLLSIVLKIKYVQESLHPALIYQSTAPVYAGPNKEYYKIHTLNNKDIVYIQAVMGDWYKVTYKQGSGWVHKDDIYDLENADHHTNLDSQL